MPRTYQRDRIASVSTTGRGLRCIGAALLFGTVVHGQSQESHQYRYLMGTSIEVQAFGADEATRRSAIDEAFAAFAEVDRLMSDYRDDSELALINRDAANGPVAISEPMFAVLDAARRVSAASNGAFDVTVAPLVRLWGFHDRTPHVPAPAELAAVRPLVDYRHVQLDADRRTVRLTQPGVALDLGGIAKGFAVDIAAGVLRRRGLTGFIDAGGNQYLLGTPPGKLRWTVGIRDPDSPGRVIAVVDAAETSVSTSADSYNVLEANGRSYGHILDPHTLQPANQSLSATILSRDGTLADAMSKAAFVLGPKAGLALVDSCPGMSAVIVYRMADGKTSVARSESLAEAYHPAPH
jgi:thiamine biosynthesis lipoprotein